MAGVPITGTNVPVGEAMNPGFQPSPELHPNRLVAHDPQGDFKGPRPERDLHSFPPVPVDRPPAKGRADRQPNGNFHPRSRQV